MFKSLTITTGKIIFALGLALNICMIFFGIWPSLIFLLLMLVGAGIVSVAGKSEPLNLNYATVKKSINVALVSLISIIAVAIVFFLFSKNYFKKRDTLNECKEMSIGLEQYKTSTGSYPINLSVLTGGNPLRVSWAKDEWEKPYKYTFTNIGKSYILRSAGADNRFDTKDDLVFEGR
jgi:uncharacterized membrane protein